MLDLTCIRCGLVKAAGEFYKAGFCKACNNAYMRAYRAANRDKVREIAQRCYQNNRAERIANARAYAVQNPPDPEQRRAGARERYALQRVTGERCSVEGCDRPRKNKTIEICAGHYGRLLRTGEATGELRPRASGPIPSECSSAGCDEPYYAHGLCRDHYRIKRYRENPEEAAAWARRRRALLLTLPAEKYTTNDILARDGDDCVLCGDPLDLEAVWPDPESVSVEHLECITWPGSAGDVLANVAAAHLSCNLSRHNRPHPRAAAKRAELVRAQSADMTG